MKTGHNAPCPCGSGKKYQKCCLARDRETARLEAEAEWSDDEPGLDEEARWMQELDPFGEVDDDLYAWAFPYDPEETPDPDAWMELSEDERILAVRGAHRGQLDDLEEGGTRLHVALHVVVENQVAEGDALPVAAKLEALRDEGLSRHDAVHAIASVFSGLWWELSTDRLDRNVDFNARYYAELEELTARSWLESVEDD